ncbi:hypothetical protein [Photobacterium profundum]|uniref:Uncharacterized protein n=1 Tax=Photobacterium profundum (strain SS9) TaxID=298386 RepID=Q6LW77_PHOPR|nr:hypothetical protein [Photobacterium profundum]CAG17995.1 hypothetical protein PBPRC0057 [Photobacterium profundum SS9]
MSEKAYNLTELEDKLRPLFEAGIAYNLMLLDECIDLNKVNKLEDLLHKLEPSSKPKVTEIINTIFEHKLPLKKNKILSKLEIDSSNEIFEHIEYIYSHFPSWHWDLYQKKTRETINPKFLLSLYFKIRKIFDNSKQKKINPHIPHNLNEALNLLYRLNYALTINMVSVINSGYNNQTSLYECHILYNKHNTTRAKALRVSLANIKSNNPLSLVKHQPLKGKKLPDWEKVLVTLSCLQSGMSNSEFLKAHLKSIPKMYWNSYIEPSILTHHRKHLAKCKNSLKSFYYTQDLNTESSHKTNQDTAEMVVRTTIANLSKAYAIMINYSDFIIELTSFSHRILNHLNNKHMIHYFLNKISSTDISTKHGYAELDDLINIDLKEFIRIEYQALSSLLSYNFPSTCWGYFIIDGFIPPPMKLLAEYVSIKEKCNKKFSSLKHEQIENFKEESIYESSSAMVNILRTVFQPILPSWIMLKTTPSFTVYDKDNLDMEVKLNLALTFEEGRFNINLDNPSFSFVKLEELLIGLAYQYQNSIITPKLSMDKFMTTLDSCYKEPINNGKLKRGKKSAEEFLNHFNEGDYSKGI